MSRLDHLSIPVSDLDRAAAFYDPVLATLGLERRKQGVGAIGYGPPDRRAPRFWLLSRRETGGASPGTGLHVSFEAPDRASVDHFHETALRAGGRDAGAPGERPEYTPPFYGAFVLDPDGFKIEAVCRVAAGVPAREAVLEGYFAALREHDWERLGACLAEDVHRIGPYRDEVHGRDAYVTFLSRVIPSLRGYVLRVSRIVHAGDDASLVLLSETVDADGGRTEFPEALLFEFDAQRRIASVDVYIKRPPARPAP